MIAYPTEQLDALESRETAARWHEKGLLDDAQWQAVLQHYPAFFKTSNIFLRIGLGFFCLIILSVAMFLSGLLLKPQSELAFSLFFLFWAAVLLFFLEQAIIRIHKYFRNGLDDMTLYVALACLIGGLCSLLPGRIDEVVYFLLSLPILVIAAIRYVDRLLSASAFCCALSIVVQLVEKVPGVAIYVLPYAGMAFCAAVYLLIKRNDGRRDLRYWRDQFGVLELLSILVFYASGNYWIVQNITAYLSGLEQPPLNWFFWLFTFAVPAMYLYTGLRRKDRLMLDSGIACIVLSFITFRHYYHLVSLSWAATIGGAVLFALSYAAIRYLRRNTRPFTYEPEGKISILQTAGEYLFEQTIAGDAAAPEKDKTGMGGGAFGGGGAGNDF